MKIIKFTCIPLAMVLLTACPGSKDDDSDIDFPNEGGDPGSVTLVFPENNSECTEGIEVNDSQSLVIFRWEAAENVDTYEVNLTNMNTNASEKFDIDDNELGITLQRNTPYRWFVVSRQEGSNKAPKSAEWQFYNAGAGVENYAPFPADVVNPKRGQTIAATGSISLEWSGNDVDNDIETFEVFFGTTDNPTSSLGTTAQSTITTDISSGQTYYWWVKTSDRVGNTSQSEIFDFKVE